MKSEGVIAAAVAAEVASAHEAYAGGAGSRTLELMNEARAYNGWIVDRLSGGLGERLLEVGCGIGAITELVAGGREVVAIDIVPEMAAATRKRLHGRGGVDVRIADVVSDARLLSALAFDSAISVNVLEHVEDDAAMLRGIWDVLQPGGTLAILVPAHSGLYGPLDRLLGHYRRYSKRQLAAKLAAAGFAVESIRRTNLVGALGWLLNVRLLRRRALGGVALYDRLVPVLRLLDWLLEPPVGLSIVAIARKPRGA